MASIGVISIGLELVKTKFDSGLRETQAAIDTSATKIGRLNGFLSASESELNAVGSAASTAGTLVKTFSGHCEGAASAASTVAAGFGTVAVAAEVTSTGLGALNVGITLVRGAFGGLVSVVKAVAAPFIFVAKVVSGLIGLFKSLVLPIVALFSPLGRLLLALKAFTVVGKLVIGVAKGAAFALRVLTYVLNPLKLASDLVRLSVRATAGAIRLLARAAGPIKSVLGSALHGVATASIVAAGALVGMAGSAAAGIDQAGDMADRLGTTTAALQSMRYAATLTGSSGEALDQSLEKMNVNLGRAATEGGPAADALKRIGLDAKQLATMDPTEAFVAISGGLKSVETPAERAALALQIFGKGGASVLTTLQAGPEEIRRLADEFKGFGGAVSESQRQSVGAMFDAMDKVKVAIQGVGAQIAVKLAPYVTRLAEGFVALATSAGGFGDAVDQAVQGIGVGFEYIGHAIDIAQLGWFGFKSHGLSAMAAVARAVARVGDTISSVVNLIPGMSVELKTTAGIMADELDRMALEAHRSGQTLLTSQGFGERFKTAFAAIGEESAKAKTGLDETTRAAIRLGDASVTNAAKIGEIVAKLREEKATFGQTSAESEIYKLKQLGATEATLKEAAAIAAEIKAMDERKKALEKNKDDAKKYIEESRTPIQKLREELARIDELKSSGLLTDKQATGAKLKARRDAGTADVPKLAAALEFGSKEARTAVLGHRGRTRDPIDDVARTGREHLGVAKKTVSVLERVAAAVTASAASPVQTVAL